jgi:PIN domain nuclease of toxin-antitoxin system
VDGPAKVNFLLDTHIWIWALTRPEKLSREVRRQIENPKNELHLSPVSVWEAHHLVRRGKLRPKPDFPDWLDQAFRQVPIKEAPFNFAVAAEASRIQLPHADPSDLFLAATASVFALTLITADAQLVDCAWLKTLANE